MSWRGSAGAGKTSGGYGRRCEQDACAPCQRGPPHARRCRGKAAVLCQKISGCHDRRRRERNLRLLKSSRRFCRLGTGSVAIRTEVLCLSKYGIITSLKRGCPLIGIKILIGPGANGLETASAFGETTYLDIILLLPEKGVSPIMQ